MPIHALDAIDDAVGPTRALVSRLGVGDWLKLGAVTLFVGGFGSVSFSANLPGEVIGSLPANVWQPADPGRTIGAVGLGFLVAATLSMFYLVRSLLEFAFYAALRDGTASVRRSLGRWWRHGVQVWALRVVVAGVLLGGGSGLASVVASGGRSVPGVDDAIVVAAIVACSFGAYAVVAGFTTRFVVPIMLLREDGVLAGWGRFLGTVAANPGQYGWYLLVGLFVRFVADVLALSAAVLLGVLLAVPVAVFLVPALLVVSVSPELALSPPLILLASGLPAGYVLALLVGALLARLPFVAYVRYYALCVLRGTDPELDLLSDARPQPGERTSSRLGFDLEQQ